MDMENASAATGSQVSVVSFSSLSAFNKTNALARLNEMHTAQECNYFCEKLEELIFYSCNNKESVLGLEELKLVNNVSWLCIKSARKANTLLATEHQKVLMAIAANQSLSPASTPSKLNNDIEVSNDFSTPKSSAGALISRLIKAHLRNQSRVRKLLP
ncbi:hypothetical protein TNCV_4976651 [Trichonephila clavipes]|nr:hypothetical protein TNCV_4976651 [Trichonephila clavipes]